MASTIQVDVIKDIGGNTIISSNGSGTFTSNLPASGATLTGSTNNQVVTVTGANAISGEANLLFDGNEMTVQGTPVVVGTNSSSVLDLKNTNSNADGRAVGIAFSTNNGGSANAHITAVQDASAKGKLNFGGYDGTSTRNIVMSVSAGTGAVTKPLQPGFSATKSTSAQAVNAAYVSVNFNNEIWDNNADWNGSTTFTAPVTGKYMFTGAMRINSILAQGGSVFGRINTSNRPYVFGNITDADDVFNATVAAYQFQGAVVADMDANDTATLDFFSNFATTIAADAERVWFQGYLLG